MLTHIQVRDYAIVEHIALDLSTGLTVVTGETGAGKSILVDALSLALGERADSNAVRHGAQRAEVAASFDVHDVKEARAWLAEHDLDAEGECLVRRVIGADGRSRSYINGNPVPLQNLKDLGELLVDIHGQHAHQSLLSRDVQRQVLDDYAGHGTLRDALAAHYHHWRNLHQEYERLTQAGAARDSRLELARYQLRELEALDLKQGEMEALQEEHGLLANASRLIEAVQAALSALDGDDDRCAVPLLGKALAEVEPSQRWDRRLAQTVELLNGALIQTSEAVGELRHYLADLDLDPARLQWVESRLDAVSQLARKHHVAPEQLPEVLDGLRREVGELENADLRAGQLKNDMEAAQQAYRSAAMALHERRVRAGAQLAQQVTENMHHLGMPGGRFEVACELVEDRWSATGIDRVELQVSANPGQPLKPLSKVASGGELSRISLALQVIVANNLQVPTLIFDEVDVGIGGRVAEIVGQMLRSLGRTRQILCVTHLPQVASQGDHHLSVEKETDGTTTHTRIRALAQAQRIAEVARMLGGVEITEQTRAHAGEMIDRAQRD